MASDGRAARLTMPLDGSVDRAAQLRRLHRISNALQQGDRRRATGRVTAAAVSNAAAATQQLRSLALAAGVLDASQLHFVTRLGEGGYARVDLCELRPLAPHEPEAVRLVGFRKGSPSPAPAPAPQPTVFAFSFGLSKPQPLALADCPTDSERSTSRSDSGAGPISLVAVKRLKQPPRDAGERARQRNASAASDLLCEAVLLSCLQHPNIVRLLGVVALPPLDADETVTAGQGAGASVGAGGAGGTGARAGRSPRASAAAMRALCSKGSVRDSAHSAASTSRADSAASCSAAAAAATTSAVAAASLAAPARGTGGASAGDGTELALVEEYVAGGSLVERIARADYTPVQALRWLADICRAVAFLHAGGASRGPAVAHRDIKPENILIGSDDGRAILCDFGLCRCAALLCAAQCCAAPRCAVMRCAALPLRWPPATSVRALSHQCVRAGNPPAARRPPAHRRLPAAPAARARVVAG